MNEKKLYSEESVDGALRLVSLGILGLLSEEDVTIVESLPKELAVKVTAHIEAARKTQQMRAMCALGDALGPAKASVVGKIIKEDLEKLKEELKKQEKGE